MIGSVKCAMFSLLSFAWTVYKRMATAQQLSPCLVWLTSSCDTCAIACSSDDTKKREQLNSCTTREMFFLRAVAITRLQILVLVLEAFFLDWRHFC